jgi:hypothetical protein
MNTREELLRILRKATSDLAVGRSPVLVASYLETVLSNNGIAVCRTDGDSPVARRWNRARDRNEAMAHLPRYENLPTEHRHKVADLFRSLDSGTCSETDVLSSFISILAHLETSSAPHPTA